jgi:predicted TIM-barrel fold metal-dependent hydrolase
MHSAAFSDPRPLTSNPSNRFAVDYAAEARKLPALNLQPPGIIDVHSHINGEQAAKLYLNIARMYGVGLTYSMTQLEQVPLMQKIFGRTMRFIAVPHWAGEDKRYHMGEGFLERIREYHRLGCRIVKFWAAPRSVDIAMKIGDPTMMRLDSPVRIRSMELAAELGMFFMTHVGDPDTWFATKYRDASIYGTKRSQYEPLEKLLDRFTQPWIAAHMGGSPEDLTMLTGLMERHPNLYLDTSAAKWMIRELSQQPREELVGFLHRFRGRVMFGSDIVTMDEHLQPAENKMEMAAKASNPEQAFDLYASRYWALRMLWESEYRGESPIADPDLKMVWPDRYSDMDGPELIGMHLSQDDLRLLYRDAAVALLDPLHAS